MCIEKGKQTTCVVQRYSTIKREQHCQHIRLRIREELRRTLSGAVETDVELLHTVIDKVDLVVRHQPEPYEEPRLAYSSNIGEDTGELTAS